MNGNGNFLIPILSEGLSILANFENRKKNNFSDSNADKPKSSHF